MKFENRIEEGLSLRDYFAAKAMQGLMSNPIMGDAALHDSADGWIKDITESAFEFADAMIREHEKGS